MDTNEQEKKVNTSTQDPKLRRIRLIQRIVLLLAAVTLLLGLYYFRGDIYDYYVKIKTEQQLAQQRENTVYSKIAFEPDSDNTYALFGTNLAVLNKSTYKLYSPEGDELISRTLGFAMPAMCISDNYVAVYDRGSPQIHLLDNNTLLETLELSGNVISVSTNDSGYMAVVREDELYRTVVSVYNAYHKLIFEWKSSEYYVMAARVSPESDKMAVSAYTQSNGTFISKIIFFDFSDEAYLSECNIENAILTNINFVSNDVIIAVGDILCAAIRSDGEVVYTYDYGNDMLKSGAESTQTVLLSFVDRTSGLGAKLVAFGPENYTFAAAADEIREISICRDYVAVLYTQSIQIFDTQLQQLTDEVAVSQVRKIIVNEDGLVMLVYAADAGFIDLLSAFRNRG